MGKLIDDAKQIVHSAIQTVLPDAAVKRALENRVFDGKVVVISVGKAAWSMARAAKEILHGRIDTGIVLTKYHHSQGDIDGFTILEAGHPLLDEQSIMSTEMIIQAVNNLNEEDTVVFLLSGGGSALFEKPAGALTLEDILNTTDKLLSCGADIVEINTIRKHLSAVKGGRFAQICAPAKVFTIALSDIVGDRIDSIASGPTCADSSTCDDAKKVIEKYQLDLPAHVHTQILIETPNKITNSEIMITGSVSQLCSAAAKTAKSLGYNPLILSTMLDCEAREAGRFLGSIARTIQKDASPIAPPCAVICGGETIVKITGNGLGGRNQEFALAGAETIAGLENVVLVGVGSDGTDGPTDAAGGIVDGNTKYRLDGKEISISTVLRENNSNFALKEVGSLLTTGPTGTNVNDLYFILIGE